MDRTPLTNDEIDEIRASRKFVMKSGYDTPGAISQYEVPPGKVGHCCCPGCNKARADHDMITKFASCTGCAESIAEFGLGYGPYPDVTETAEPVITKSPVMENSDFATMMIRQLQNTWKTSSNPAERETAYQALTKYWES